jgi:hypothetical protein
MGLQEIDIFKDMNDSEKFASAIIPQKSLNEKFRDLISGITGGRVREFLPEEEKALRPTGSELL